MSTVAIPVKIIRNFNLSPRVRLVWIELSMLPKDEQNEIWFKQKEFAKLLGICVSTLRRAIKQLKECGLLKFVGYVNERFKKYVFGNPRSEWTPHQVPGDKEPSRGNDNYGKPPAQIVDTFMINYGRVWQHIFPNLDGKDERPDLREAIGKILMQKECLSRKDLPRYVESELKEWSQMVA